ncbi:hypothetical protein [Leifsonia sp. PS1209]|uniref:hypothetical protein n=1 Tax=Leifsonia sp. PS1209 TaxID=2724914 RepID=UPI001442A494|nr:hypothetical protein [Leifsonia sp. PS1209]QIZ99826.1 hypothetical protein HF024_15795 [Leifsonia sp. PS1209]
MTHHRSSSRPSPDEEIVATVLGTFARERYALAAVTGAIVLVASAAIVNSARPLFGHSGFGLAISLTSCLAGILLSAVTLVWSVINRSSDRHVSEHLRGTHVVAWALTFVISGAAILDLVAFAVILRR